MDLPNDPSTLKSPRVAVHRRKRFQDFAVAVHGCFKESKDSVDKSRFNPGVLIEVFCENGSSDKYVHFSDRRLSRSALVVLNARPSV